MATVLLGNLNPIKAPVGTSVAVNDEPLAGSEPMEGRTIVLIDTPHDRPLDEQLREVRNAFRIHSTGDAAWVESGDPFFATAVSQVFNCPVGRPKDWDAPVASQEPPAASSSVGTVDEIVLTAHDVTSVSDLGLAF